MATNSMSMTVIGNLGKNATVRTLPSGKQVADVSCFVNGAGEAHIVKIQVWGDKRAEGVAPKLLKGSLMSFTGTPRANAWVKDGVLRSELVLNVNFNDKIGWLSSPKPAAVADTADQNVLEEDQIPF